MDTEYQPMSVRPTPDMRERIRALARRERRSISSQIVWLLEYALCHVEHTPTATPSVGSSSDVPGEPVHQSAHAESEADAR